MNTKTSSEVKKISQLLRTIGQPARLRILLAIGKGEACVCHLEALLGLRQAYISQHLMDLRKARILTTRRDGRYIYYRLRDPHLLELIQGAGAIAGIPEPELRQMLYTTPIPQCCCPNCLDTIQSTSTSPEIPIPIIENISGDQRG